MIFSHLSYGQNYTPFDADASKRFVNTQDTNDDDYFFYSTSFTTAGSVTSFQQYYTYQNYEEYVEYFDCEFWGGTFMILDTTWLGNRINYDHDNMFLDLLNETGDSLGFDFGMSINDSTLFFESDSLLYFIKYTSISNELALGLIDSTKHFEIITYDSLGNNIINSLSEFEILLTKNNGLISFIDCYHFPNELKSMEIMGQTNPLLGNYQLSYFEAYPWQEGDVIQYRGRNGYAGTNYTKYTYQTVTVNSRIEFGDSISIYYSSVYNTVYSPSGPDIEAVYMPIPTSPITYNVNDLILSMPHNMANTTSTTLAEFYIEDSTNSCGGSERLIFQEDYSIYCDTCKCYGWIDGYNSAAYIRHFNEKRGLVYYDLIIYGMPQENDGLSASIIYSDINNVVCGNPWVLDIDENEIGEAKLYPNPTIGLFTLSSNKTPEKIRIVDQLGRVVYYSIKGLSKTTEIDLRGENPGSYILQLFFDDGTISNKQLIIGLGF